MKILLLNQTFYPDHVATAQYLKDLALGLAEKGHEVTVLCSNRAYDDVQKRFPSHECWRPKVGTRSTAFPDQTEGSTGVSPVDSRVSRESQSFNKQEFPTPQLRASTSSPSPGGEGRGEDEQLPAPASPPLKDCGYGIEIHRVGSLGLGKSAKWKRAADFASFFLAATFKSFRLPRHDVVIALTSPPLISLLGARLAKRWRGRFYYWVMDLNPDEAIAAGWLQPDSFAAKVLNGISNYSLRRAKKIIVLDRFMQERIEAKGIDSGKIEIIPPWSHDDEIEVDSTGREEFRKAHGLENKFVVMYSGNHSPCHPLDTLLDAAKEFQGNTGDSPKDTILHPPSSLPTPEPGSTGDSPVPFGDSPKGSITPDSSLLTPSIVFCFIGGGSEWRKIQNSIQQSEFSSQNSDGKTQNLKLKIQNSNLLCLPYQPFDKLSASLSAADLHVVVMGDPFVGTIHPCKIYNMLNIGAPVLYIGPATGHVPDIFNGRQCGENFYAARHGDGKAVAANIRCARDRKAVLPIKTIQETGQQFAKDIWLPRFISLLLTP